MLSHEVCHDPVDDNVSFASSALGYALEREADRGRTAQQAE